MASIFNRAFYWLSTPRAKWIILAGLVLDALLLWLVYGVALYFADPGGRLSASDERWLWTATDPLQVIRLSLSLAIFVAMILSPFQRAYNRSNDRPAAQGILPSEFWAFVRDGVWEFFGVFVTLARGLAQLLGLVMVALRAVAQWLARTWKAAGGMTRREWYELTVRVSLTLLGASGGILGFWWMMIDLSACRADNLNADQLPCFGIGVVLVLYMTALLGITCGMAFTLFRLSGVEPWVKREKRT